MMWLGWKVYYSALRQRDGAWFGAGQGEGPGVTTVVNRQGHYLLQARYLVATCQVSWINLPTCVLVYIGSLYRLSEYA